MTPAGNLLIENAAGNQRNDKTDEHHGGIHE
jgi:hypothetical protein